jgi:hypothetical protein
MDSAIAIELHDNEDSDSWDASKWVGVGKTWPSQNIPTALINARDALFPIREEIQASTLPARALPVTDFLAFNLPSQSDP